MFWEKIAISWNLVKCLKTIRLNVDLKKSIKFLKYFIQDKCLVYNLQKRVMNNYLMLNVKIHLHILCIIRPQFLDIHTVIF